MANTRKTKREFYAELREVVADNAELVAFIDHEVELLDKKNKNKSSKPTKVQIENENIKVRIVEYLNGTGESTRIKGLQENGFDYSTSKLSALLKQLVDDNKVEKFYEKKVAYFKAV